MLKIDYIKRYFLVKIMSVLKYQAMKKTYNPYKVQKKLLREILKANENTALHSDFGLKHSMTVDEFRSVMPLTTYDTYEPYVERMLKNEKNVLTSDKIVYFTYTTGTSTGKPRIIPHTALSLEKQTRAIFVSIFFTIEELYKKGYFFDKGVNFMSTMKEGITDFGVPYGPSSCCGQYIFGRETNTRNQRIVPYDCCKVSGELLEYISWLFALASEKVSFIGALYPLTLISAYKTLQRYALDLIKDLEEGTLTEKLPFPDDVRKSVLSFHKPDKERARKIRELYNKSNCLNPKEIWTGLACLITARGGPSKYYVSQLNKLYGDLPVYCPSYNASEGMGAFGYSAKDEMILATSATFLEFIPFDKINEEQPKTLLSHELEVGKLYEIVFTTINGFYRYRMADIIKVTGMINNTPKIEFQYRRGGILSAAYEKVDERQVITIVENVMKELKLQTKAFVVGIDKSEDIPRYCLVLEINKLEDKNLIGKISELFDIQAKEINFYYKKLRDFKSIGEPYAFFVKDNEIINYFYSKARIANQVKVPHVSEDEAFWEYMSENKV